MRLGSLLTRSTDEGIPISRKQCREDVVGIKKILKKLNKKILTKKQALQHQKDHNYKSKCCIREYKLCQSK